MRNIITIKNIIVYKRTIIFLSSISLLIMCFLGGLYLGTINHNFLGEKKDAVFNLKRAFLRRLSNKDYKVNTITIILDTSDYRSILREQSYFSSQKWLDKKLANYYKCKIKLDNKNLKGKIRNKGLLLKPWEYNQGCYSYKVKLKKGEIKGLNKFYLNYPKKRNNLHEWYGDKIYKYYKLINQKNFFVNLDINNNKKGLYLLEESFDGKLLTNNEKSLGPIIYYGKEEIIKSDDYGESFFRSKIKFQYPSEYNDTAKELLNNFIQKESSVGETFDFEKTATHFALADLIGYYHQLNYHNVKFYYNTTNKKLEPIANDFQFYDIRKWTKESFGIVFNKQNINRNYLTYLDAPWMKILFENNEFFSLYLEKLGDFSRENKIDSLFDYLKPYEDSAIGIMSTFEPLYVPKVKSIIKNNAEHIRSILKKQKPVLINSPKIDSNKNILLEIKNSNYIPIKILGIYQNDNLISNIGENYFLTGKNYGEPVDVYKIKFLLKKEILVDVSLQFKYQYLGESFLNQVLFKL